ncbi:glycoside hydrolase family 5 protein [Spirosoma montaniterrae]|uniref:Glycoside hydrolase family 5 domain-containing protein n=1 Tax=Spirosoma montaniterrae TaxID=1178516 RepID=A0A1P9WUQ2_9BACT|nr:cellulase family glycosylhydrolase [Spirosoma montaniterrae]AQG79101.1 hypothetical protein AWR27_07065 [Spirosoma montaniterrae]
MNKLIWFVFVALCYACKPGPTTDGVTPTDAAAEASGARMAVIRRDGSRLLGPDGQPIWLRGVAFGNEIWSNAPVPPTTHHTEVDYERVRDMGMNAVRFYLNYTFFEDDARPYVYKQTGWAWLDQNIAWAKKHGIYLILNMHAPQGGYQSQGNGKALWDVPENQKRLTALWKAIAQRYATEPVIGGYDLVNEPNTTRSIDQWKTLAQQITDAIRTVDRNHLVVIERVNAINNEWKDFNGERNMFLINDSNVLYQFHTYDPHEYTHQLMSWTNLGDGGAYPDPNRVYAPSDARWYAASFNNPALAAGSSDWTYYEGTNYTVADPKMKLAKAVIQVSKVGGGAVWLDDVVVKEYTTNGQFVRDVLWQPLNDQNGWYFWSSNNTGGWQLASEGHSDAKSLRFTGTTEDANAGCYALPFAPKQGYAYRISGWMKTSNLPATATVRLRADFETSDQPVFTRDKMYMLANIQPYLDWGKRNNVPLFMGEFGVGDPCFDNNKGGVQWVSDVLDIARPNNLHFTYHAYHEDSFGIYPGYGRLPVASEGNQPLIDLFRQKLK